MNTKIALPVKGLRLLLTSSLALIIVVFTLVNWLVHPAQAATSSTVNFQARLMTATGTIVPDGNYNVEFKLFNSASSSGSSQGSCSGDSACLWTETRVTTDKIRVANGYLTANLGSVTAFPAINWDQELWLTMNIGGTGSPGWDGEMTPRLKLTAVPYAFTAGQLVATDGANTSNLSFVQPTADRSILLPDESGTICLQNSGDCGFMTGSATDFIQNQNSTNQTANFRISGTGRANTGIMTPLLQPTADGTTALKIQNTGATVTAMTVDTTNGRITIGADTAAQEKLDVVGNLQVRDAATATKSYRLRTSGGSLDLEGSGANLYLSLWSGAGYTGTQYNQIIFKSNGDSMDFARGFNVSDAAARVGLGGNVNPQYSLDVTGDINTSTQYRIGGTVICTASGCTPAAGSGSYIQNQNSSDQTANFRINGTGRAGTALQAPLIDTATAAALNIGTTNATSINLNKATAVTGNLSQSGGTVSLAATGTGALTATGALTLTGGAASTWSTSAGALTIQAATTNALNLRTAGAGTVALGDTNSTTVNIGRGSDIARTINIGTAGSTTAQTIGIGSTGSTSTTTIQGGTGASAIALTTGTNGNINLTTTGTGTINLTTGSAGVIVKPTTDNGSAFQVQNAAGSYIFNVNTVFGLVNIGNLNIGIGTNIALIDTTTSGDTLNIANTNASTVNIGRTAAAVTIQGTSASTFKGTSGSFTTTLGFTTPTANRAINLPDEAGTVCLQASVNCGFALGTAANYIQNTTTLQNANMAVQAATSGSITAVLQANAAGTADILSLRNGAGTAVATFGYSGATLFKNSANSLTAFQVQNAAGVAVLNVDTTNQRVAIGNVAPALKFEVQGGDAAIYNSGNSARLVLGDSATSGQYGWLQWDSTNDYFRIETVGSNGLKINDNFVSIGNIFPSKPLIVGSGTNPLFEVGATGQIQARTSTNATTAFQIQNNVGDVFLNADSTNKRIGIGDGNDAPEVELDVWGAIQQTGMQTPNTAGTDANEWTKLGSCTITAQYNQCLTKIDILGGNDGSAGNNSQGTVTVRVKQQNAMGGVPYINVTLNDTAEVITKSDIVAVTTVNSGAATTVELYGRITNSFENWYYAPVMNTGGYGESTWNWSPFSTFTPTLPGGVQTPARYGNSNANLLTVEATDANAFHVQDAAGTQIFNVDTVDGIVMLGTGFGATKHIAMDIETNAYIEIVNSTGNGVTLSQAEGGNSYLTYDTDMILQRSANSATDLRVLDASDIAQFTVDTTNKQIEIGTSDTTGTVLVLDTKTGAGDPTGIDGAMYYNSSSKAFRCYSNGAWRSCVAGVVFANTTVPAGNTVSNTTADTNFASNYSIPANDCQPGRVYRITAQGTWGDTTAAPTLNMKVKFGSTQVGATGAVSVSQVSQTARTWRLEYAFTCLTTGASGTVEGQGVFTRFHTNEQTSVLWGMTTTGAVTVNTTTAQTLQVSATFGTANAANTITMRQLIIEASGP